LPPLTLRRPVAQLTLLSETASESQLFDWSLNFLRIRLFTIPGLALPAPYGGASRQINVDVDPRMAAARGVSPQDVSATLQSMNIIEPAGVARIGKLEYNVLTNSSPTKVEDFGLSRSRSSTVGRSDSARWRTFMTATPTK